MADGGFLRSLQEFDKDGVKEKDVKKVKEYMKASQRMEGARDGAAGWSRPLVAGESTRGTPILRPAIIHSRPHMEYLLTHIRRSRPHTRRIVS